MEWHEPTRATHGHALETLPARPRGPPALPWPPQGVVGEEGHATGYRLLCVLFPPADVDDSDPLSALQHVPQRPRVDVVPLRHFPAPRPLATPKAGSTPYPGALPPAPSGRWAPCSAAAPRRRRPPPPARRGPVRPGRCHPGTEPAWRSTPRGWR